MTLLAPVLTYLINLYVTNNTDYRIGVELIILNGFLTFLGLWCVRSKNIENKINDYDKTHKVNNVIKDQDNKPFLKEIEEETATAHDFIR